MSQSRSVFQETDADTYILSSLKEWWPKGNWTLLLLSALIGKAREIDTQLVIFRESFVL